MSVLMRTRVGSTSNTTRCLGLVVATSAAALAGCSASITRFDNPSFAIGEGSASTGRRTGQSTALDLPPPSAPASQAAPRATQAEMASLPVLEGANASQSPRTQSIPRQAPQMAAVHGPSAAPGRDRQIEVQQGDTLYGIAKRHNVMISDLMAANELRSPALKPGQKLYIPSTGGGRAVPQIKPERSAVAKAAPAAPAAAPAELTAPSAASIAGGSDTYTVRPGDSLYAIAARHKVKVIDLQRANDISDATKVKPGMVLRLPSRQGTATAGTPATALQGETVQPETRIVRVVPAAGASPPGVKVLNGQETQGRLAAADAGATATDATPANAQPTKLRWPVKGRVVQGFGARADGSHNDGLDIAVPAGTEVAAAEGGVVAYAGNEVKSYGNLILIRHDNGWVTAYAYNDKLLVQRGDRVKRGQSIAKAGKTGAADQPQVHFEVRVGSKPVDPVGYLDRM